jgi:hypothetical protein
MGLVRQYCGISVIMFFFLASFVEADLLDGLVMYLPFDAGQGDVAADLSGNGHNGDLKGTEWVAGKFGKALTFNGADSFVEVPFSDDFVVTEAITIGVWVTANVPFVPDWHCIINARKSTYGPFLLQTGGASKAEVGLYLQGAWTWLRTGNSLEPGVFHHVVGTYDLENGLHLYFDGVLDDGEGSAGAKAGEIDAVPDEGVVIGHNYSMADRWWDGEIDEVVIYNRALSADEVAELFADSLSSTMAVEPEDKLAATWGRIKCR